MLREPQAGQDTHRHIEQRSPERGGETHEHRIAARLHEIAPAPGRAHVGAPARPFEPGQVAGNEKARYRQPHHEPIGGWSYRFPLLGLSFSTRVCHQAFVLRTMAFS